jgi:transcription elongation factor Elf1
VGSSTKKKIKVKKEVRKEPKIKTCPICGGTGQFRVVYRGEDGKAKGAYVYCRSNPDESFKPTVPFKKYILKEE